MKLRSLVLATLLSYSLSACDQPTQAPQENKKTSAISPVDFVFTDLDGKPRSLKEWQGKFIVLNFWASWCPPCREEIPSFIELQEQYRDAGLQFIGIAIDDAVSVQRFAQQLEINYPLLIAQTQGIELAKQYGNLSGALPFSVLINTDGEIVARHTGILTAAKIIEFSKLRKD